MAAERARPTADPAGSPGEPMRRSSRAGPSCDLSDGRRPSLSRPRRARCPSAAVGGCCPPGLHTRTAHRGPAQPTGRPPRQPSTGDDWVRQPARTVREARRHSTTSRPAECSPGRVERVPCHEGCPTLGSEPRGLGWPVGGRPSIAESRPAAHPADGPPGTRDTSRQPSTPAALPRRRAPPPETWNRAGGRG